MYFDEVKKAVTAKEIQKEIDCLTTVSLSICDWCNRGCSYCPHGQGYVPAEDGMMSVETAIAVRKRLEELETRPRVTISGMGEPFLNPKLREILHILASFMPIVITNGTVKPKWDIPDGVRIVVSIHNMREAGLLKERWPQAIFRNHDPSDPGFELHATNRNGYAGKKENCRGKCYCPFYKMLVDWDGSYIRCAEDWKRESRRSCCNVRSISIEEWFVSVQAQLKQKMIASGREDIPECRHCDIAGTMMGEKSFEWYTRNSKRKSRRGSLQQESVAGHRANNVQD